MSYILGVDGGNTKTVALVANLQGEVLGWGRSGCGDIYNAGSPAQAFTAIDSAVGEALRAAGVRNGELLAGAFSMAGADWPEDFRLLEQMLSERKYGRSVRVVNDAIGGLRAGNPEGTGVSVILGTGLAVGARGPAGQIWHGSFWVRTVDSFHLTESIYDAIVFAELGFTPPTALTEIVLRLYEVDNAEQFLHTITRREDRRSVGKGRLVSALLDAAAAGDVTANGIVYAYADGCAKYAVLSAERVGYRAADPLKLVFSGGQLRHPSTILSDRITAQVRTRFPHAAAIRSEREPAAGALMYGFEEAGIPITPDVIRRLTATMPPASFFESN